MTPTSLYDIGRFLQEAGKTLSSNHDVLEVETVVAEVGRKVRTIVQNSLCYNSGMNTVNAAEEMIRIFERLFFDWVLAPSSVRPALKDLDDDRCIEHHKSDLTSMVLLCDGCEGKYNMTRLKPPLARVPSGDWYCPRCVAGRCWATVDPRIGRQVLTGALSGTVESCKFIFSENGKPSILYSIKPVNSGLIEFWQLKDVDDSIVGDPVEPLCCLQALAESPGYGFGRDYGTLLGALPLAINPLVGDNAAQASLSSGAFRDTVSACISLTNPPEDIKAEEWVTLLSLLVMKCSSSDTIQELSSSLETKAAGRLSSELSNFSKVKGAQDMIPDFSEDETVSSEEDASDPPLKATDSAEMKVETKVNDTHSSNEEMSGGEFASENEPSVQKSCEAPNDGNATNVTDIDEPFSIAAPSEEDIFRKKREFAFLSKSRREKKREEALMGFYVGNRLKSTAASFEEDFLSTIVKSTLCTQQHGLDISSVRCKETCHYCGLSDVALGAPLCRVPDDNEWKEAFPHAVHDRFTYIIAEVADPNPSKEDTSNLVNGIKQELKEEKSTKVFTVRVRVGGELVSSKADFIDRPTKNFDSIMQQFLPKNPHAFQSELKFRHESELSFYSGSLTAHEVCAMSAHRSRKNKLLHERRRCHELNIVRESAISCGKSTPIGVDNWGRAYWIFSSDPRSLFICASNKIDRNSGKNKKWHRFHEPEEIASIMVCLGKEPPCDSLKEIFPEAFKLVKDRSWSTLLMDRAYSDENKPQKTLPPSKPSKADQGQIDEDLGPVSIILRDSLFLVD